MKAGHGCKRIIITWAVLKRPRLHYELCYALLQRRAVDRPVKAMGILDGIVEWIAEQIMYGLDLINASVLGALGCDMNTFLRYFPAAETMYSLLVALAIGLILLGWVWNLFKNYGLGPGRGRGGSGQADRQGDPVHCACVLRG